MYKKSVALLLFAGVLGLAEAQFTEEPKLTRDMAKLISPWQTYSVEVVKTMPNETYVTLEGCILERIEGRDEYYRFADGSDEIVVEIDDKLWRGQKVSRETDIKLLAEVEKREKRSRKRERDDSTRVKLDVKYLEILPKE